MASILVIDQHPACRDLLRGVLESAQYHVAEASDGFQAFRMMRVDPPDMVITEIYMPHIDGIEILTAVKRGPRFCKVVAMAEEESRSPFDALEAARLLGADGILGKPLQPSELLSTVDRVLRRAAPAGPSISAGMPALMKVSGR